MVALSLQVGRRNYRSSSKIAVRWGRVKKIESRLVRQLHCRTRATGVAVQLPPQLQSDDAGSYFGSMASKWTESGLFPGARRTRTGTPGKRSNQLSEINSWP
jgi:hypothetical protein